MVSRFIVGIISIIIVFFCICVLIKNDNLKKIYNAFTDIPKFAKITLTITAIVLLIFLVVIEIMEYFK